MIIFAALIALAWIALAARLFARLRAFKPLLPIDHPAALDSPAVDAIVPARDEEREVERAVASILGQEYPGLRVTVIDDQSTDATGAILDHLAASQPPGGPLQVVHGEGRPLGWVGKTWALQQGVGRTVADWLWFVDGDMVLHPRALATAMAVARDANADLVSFLPRADCKTFWQRAAGLMLTQLLAHVYPIDRVNDPTRPDALAAGGFILVKRATYERAGGHAAVRGEIIEDIQLARRVKQSGGRLAIRVAPALAGTHMYGTLGEIWRGLRKNAYAGMEYQPHKFVVGAIVALVMAWTPPLALIFGTVLSSWPLTLFGALGWLAQAAATAPFAVFLGQPIPYAFSLPAGISLYVAIATSSVYHHHRGRVLWKGRAYTPDVVAATPEPRRP